MVILPSTSQTNEQDCGVFAAAFTPRNSPTKRVAGNGVARLQAPFDVAAMRTHLEVETVLGERNAVISSCS